MHQNSLEIRLLLEIKCLSRDRINKFKGHSHRSRSISDVILDCICKTLPLVRLHAG